MMIPLQRPYRGSRVSSFYPVKSLPPLSSLDSAFQLQEYISLLIRLDVHDVDAIVSLPGKPAPKDHDDVIDSPDHDAKRPDDADRKSEISVDRACWIYEQLRRLAQDLSHPLITMLQQECTRSSCPQMKAGEWLYLCVAHGNDGAMEQCCAIDYILHTVDSATALLNSPRAFPSRLSIPQTSHRHFSSLARRLGRIFAHAYFHHREAFEQAEAESSLYARFLKLTNQFDLVPAEFLVIPENAIHHDNKTHTDQVEPPRLFSAAVHPVPIPRHDARTADSLADSIDPRSRSVDAVNHIGTDSPRRLGRSRTDTMVFSEGFSVTEDLSRSEDADGPATSSLLDISSAISGEARPDLETRTDDLDDEDIGDAHSDLTLAPPLSPPVEELSLISLEETPSAIPSHEIATDEDQSEPLQQPDAAAVEVDPEQLVQVTEEHALPEELSIPVAAEFAVEVPEVPDTVSSKPSTESSEILPEPEEDTAESVTEDAGPVVSSIISDSQSMEADLPPPPAPLLELNEPPPSEPIPPESESDITDEATGLEGNEVRKTGEEEAAVGE